MKFSVENSRFRSSYLPFLLMIFGSFGLSPWHGTAQTPPGPVPAASQSVQQPSVLLKNGVLQVQANNSDLSQILREVAIEGGMTIDGTVPTARVYGTYGPGASRSVLTDLLTGLNCNFVMVGSTYRGVPKKLVLTARGSGPPPASTSAASPSTSAPSSTASTPDPDAPGPGAIVHVPPEGPDDPQTRSQQNLQRLQQMHDQQNKPGQPQ